MSCAGGGPVQYRTTRDEHSTEEDRQATSTHDRDATSVWPEFASDSDFERSVILNESVNGADIFDTACREATRPSNRLSDQTWERVAHDLGRPVRQKNVVVP